MPETYEIVKDRIREDASEGKSRKGCYQNRNAEKKKTWGFSICIDFAAFLIIVRKLDKKTPIMQTCFSECYVFIYYHDGLFLDLVRFQALRKPPGAFLPNTSNNYIGYPMN